jgi:hypothetical protein
MTFRALSELLFKFIADHPDHEALDEPVVVRVQTRGDDEDLHVGGLREATVDAGCTDTLALVLDADQELEPQADGDGATDDRDVTSAGD